MTGSDQLEMWPPANTSYVVMAQRKGGLKGGLDFFPTPPWATRALLEYVMHPVWKSYTALDPACGEGHMVRPLREYFREVYASDIKDYGKGFAVLDYMEGEVRRQHV